MRDLGGGSTDWKAADPMEKPDQELSVDLLEVADDHLEERIQERFTFGDFKKFVKKHGRELSTENEKPEKETLHPSPQILDSAKRQRRSRRLLIFVGLLCVVLGFFLLAIMFLNKPGERRTQLVGAQARFPIEFIEKEDGPKTSGAVAQEAMGEKPLERILPQGEEPIASEPLGPSTIIEEGPIGSKKLFIAGRYTVNVASFRDKRNTDQLMRELEEKGYEVFVEEANIPQKGVWYRVAVGRFPSRREAQAFARGLKERDGINSFVRKLKTAKQ